MTIVAHNPVVAAWSTGHHDPERGDKVYAVLADGTVWQKQPNCPWIKVYGPITATHQQETEE